MWLHSYFLAGLVQLEKEGVITLGVMGGHDLRRCMDMQMNPYPLFTLKCSEVDSNKSRVICFDPKDQSDAWQTKALEECDVYFKRSTHRPDTERLTRPRQSKVRPINPMFATWCSGAGSWNARLYAALVMRAGRQIVARQQSRQALSSMLNNIRSFAFLSTLDNYEDSPAGSKREQVLFQTRLWDPSEEKGEWVEDCNLNSSSTVRPH